MRLSSLSNGFVFNLPSDFIPQEVINRYNPILKKNWVQYEDVLSYINSTIKGIDIPGLSFETPKQTWIRGKEMNFKPATNVNDIMTREFTITFRSVDNDLNYWIMYDIFIKHYLDVEHTHVNPFIVTAVDIHRDGIYQIEFKQLIIKNLSELKFDYSQQKVTSKEFTITAIFNFFDINFLLDQSKIIDLSGTNPIIREKR